MQNEMITARLREQAELRRSLAPAPLPLDGTRTALLVIDLQEFFMAPGMPMEVPAARDVVPNVNRLAGAVREAGGSVMWLRMTADPDAPRWGAFFEMRPDWMESAMTELLRAGQPGHRLWAGLEVQPGDPVVDKTRFSALIQGSSDLDAQLRARGVDTVLVTGTLSNVCCESTARDALMLGYRVAFVSDANAARDELTHSAVLFSLAGVFADVPTTDEVVAALGRVPQEHLPAG
ncbi:cysteine hydrolase family protein [Modestobacter lapidis]|nr:cysteine hydrolase [Modestobacter lapidis]